MCSANPLRPQNWIDTDRTSRRNGDETVLSDSVGRQDESDVARASDNFQADGCDPGGEVLILNDVADEDEGEAAEGVGWHRHEL